MVDLAERASKAVVSEDHNQTHSDYVYVNMQQVVSDLRDDL